MNAKYLLTMLCQENLDLEKCSVDNGSYLNSCSLFDYFDFTEDIEYFYFYGREDEYFGFLPTEDFKLKDPYSDCMVYFWVID